MLKSAFKLAKYVKPYWYWAALAPLLMLMEVTLDLMQPRLVQRIIDDGIAKSNLPLAIQTGLLMAGLALIGLLGGGGNGIFAEIAANSFAADLREVLFRKVQTFSFGNLDKLETGQLVTRLTNDVTQVQDALLMLLRMLIRAPLLLIGSLIMAIITSPELTFIPVILMPIELVIVLWVMRKATPLYTFVQEKLDTLNEVMQENLAGVRVVKAFVRARHEEGRFASANAALRDQSILAARTVSIVMPFMILTMNSGIVAVLWFGGVHVSQGSMHDGQIIAFVNYLTTTLFSLMMVSQMVIQLARAEASAVRIQEILDSRPTVMDGPLPRQDITIHGRVAFENVAFAYNGNSADPVLKGITFKAEPGEIVAILGTTGAGKSSLVNLIPRFYDVSAGRVLVDGVDVREIKLELLRSSIGIALQETVLFSGSIRDNIRYGRSDASEEEVISAAQAAQIHDFIVDMPEGYNTMLGQRGVNLSGGQKQRIAIARAILIHPSILILDDSTSSVDIETESKIQAAFEQMMRQHTSIIIAQRITTVLKADKILVMDEGQITAQGTHQELMASSPIYQDIYESQLGNGEGSHE